MGDHQEKTDQQKLADDVETEILQTRKTLAFVARSAALHILATIADRPEGAGTGQLADLAYTFACLEGAQRGALPGTPPPPQKRAPAAEPPRQPTSSPEPGTKLPPFGNATRTNR